MAIFLFRGQVTGPGRADQRGPLITNQAQQILGDEQTGLTHLTKIIQKGLRDIGVIYGEELRDEGPPMDFVSIGGGR